MFKKIILFFLAAAFISTVSGFIYSQTNPETDTIVINSINIYGDKGLIQADSVSFKEASGWAVNKRLTLAPDAPPLIDGNAFFISQFQTIIPVSGYRKELLYSIYFDFLRYNESSLPFNSKLKIFIRDIYGNKRKIGTADLTFMSDKKKFEVSIPFDLSYPGKFDIIIHEYAGKTGNWGIWDIIVTSRKINEIELMPIDSQGAIKEIESKIFK